MPRDTRIFLLDPSMDDTSILGVLLSQSAQNNWLFDGNIIKKYIQNEIFIAQMELQASGRASN